MISFCEMAKPVLEDLSYVVVIAGLPIAIISYMLAKRKEQRDAQDTIYNSLDERYAQFEKICLENPDLDVADEPDVEHKSKNNAEKKKELIIYQLLISMFERAYTNYNDQDTSFRQRQWTGWDAYIRKYAQRENFRDAWKISGAYYDTEFQVYMNRVIDEAKRAAK